MSDHYVFSFAFELRLNVDGRVLGVFEALARGENPQATDLAASAGRTEFLRQPNGVWPA